MSEMLFIPKVEVDRQRVAKHLGYTSALPSAVNKAIDDSLDRANDLISPRGVYNLKEIVSFSGESILIEGNISFNTAKIGSYLIKCCDQIAVFLLTIGHDLEKEVDKLMGQGEFLSALILDALGSEAVDTAANHFKELIRGSQNERGVTPRFSPGCCDWKLSDQSSIFKLLDSSKLGVELTESYMMIPRKSISGVVGLGRIEKTIKEPIPCQFCSNRDCPNWALFHSKEKTFKVNEMRGC